MEDLSAHGLADGELDDILVFWHSGKLRRAVVSWDYGNARGYLSRLLSLIDGSWAEQSINSQLTRLRHSGEAVVSGVGRHRLGLMRPKLLGSRTAIEAADPPFLIAFEVSEYAIKLPVLAASREDAVRLVRQLDEGGVAEKQGWRSYICERQTGTWERLLLHAVRGQVLTHHTELERLMLSVAHRQHAKRAA